MAKGINKVILVGNLGGDPEVRYMPNGNAVATIAVATTDSWKDKQTGDKQERTEWHRVVFFNRLGEIVGEYLRKGSKVYVEGSLRTRKWQDSNGQDRYTTEIIGSEMQMLDSRTGGTANVSGGFSDAGQFAPAASSSKPPAPAAQGEPAPAPAGGNDFDDDIPF